MTIDLKNTTATERTLLGMVRPSASRVPARATESTRATPVSSEQAPHRSVRGKAQRHGQWALIAQAQTRIADLQAAEQAVVNAYRQLLQVSRQLEQAGSAQREGLAQQVERLAAQLRAQQPPVLDAELVPTVLRKGGGRASYLLTRVDLLTPRSQPEQLHLVFSGSRQAVELNIPSDAGAQQVVQALREQLAPLGIQAGVNQRQQLEFSVPVAEQARLSAPLLVTGQGIRVPAGNPVPIALEPRPGALDELAGELREGERLAQRERIRQLLSGLEQQRRQLQLHSQQIISRLNQIRSDTVAVNEAVQLGHQLEAALRDASFTEHVGVLLAQANVSRHAVVALLAK